MTNEDLEAVLARYRPTDPHAGLRQRVLAAAAAQTAGAVVSAWDWVLAVASLVLIAMWAATTPGNRVPADSPEEIVWRQVVTEVASGLAGGADARRLAAFVVPRPEALKSLPPAEAR